MAISDSLNKRLRARRDEEEEEVDVNSVSDEMEDSESNADEEERDSDSNSAESHSDDEEEEEDNEDSSSDISDTGSAQSANDREAIQSEFRQISFGALAKAQNAIGRKRKRGAEDNKSEEQTDEKKSSSTLEDIRERLRIARERKLGINTSTSNQSNNNNNNNGYNNHPKPPSRTSKHAPAVQSSKVAVSRKRTIMEPPTVKSRDPRFDPTVVKTSASARRNNSSAENAYAFLDEYRASEIKQLKEQLAKTKDASQKEQLKRAITSATDRQRTLENRKREQEVLQEHKRKEKQLIKEGKKSQPYFLKNSELKKEVLKKKYESMGSKERTKALERRRKKVASKEKKDLPWARRSMMTES